MFRIFFRFPRKEQSARDSSEKPALITTKPAVLARSSKLPDFYLDTNVSRVDDGETIQVAPPFTPEREDLERESQGRREPEDTLNGER